MKSFFRYASILLLVIVSCSKQQESEVLIAHFSRTEDIIALNSDYDLPFQVSSNLGPFENYDFSRNKYKAVTESGDPSIVEVIDCGTVRGVGNGRTMVNVTLSGRKYSMALTVVDSIPGKPVNRDSLTVVNADWNWTTASTGVTTGYASFKLFGKQASISAAHYPASKLALSIAYHTGSNCLTTSAAGREAGAAVAINGSFFNTTSLVASTFYASGGKIICNTSLDTRSNGIVGIKPGGHNIDILSAKTAEFSSYAEKYFDVIASGPVLMQKGAVVSNVSNDFNDTSHPRSIIGKDEKNNIWMIVIDGRFSGKGEGASIEECSLICKYLGLYDAINLDGGGSSSLWTPSTGVINHPCDNKKWDHEGERKDPTIFVAK